MKQQVRKIDNGYLLADERGSESFFGSCEELFAALLLRLEGRGKHFGGDSFGTVFIARKAGEKYTAPAEAEPV